MNRKDKMKKIKYENVSIFLITIVIIIDLIKVLYEITTTTKMFTIFGIIITILEMMLLYKMCDRIEDIIKNTIKKEENHHTRKSLID